MFHWAIFSANVSRIRDLLNWGVVPMVFENQLIAVPVSALRRSHIPCIPRKRLMLSCCFMLKRSGWGGECMDFSTIWVSILCIPNPMCGCVWTGICDSPLGGLVLPCCPFGDWRVYGRFPRCRCLSKNGVGRLGRTCAA